MSWGFQRKEEGKVLLLEGCWVLTLMLGGLHHPKEEVGYGSCVALEEERTTSTVFLPEMEPESDPAQGHEQLTGNRG